MDVQKKNRIAAALTVNVILLIVILAAVIIYQLVEIVGGMSAVKKIEAEKAYYEQLLEDAEKDKDFLQSEKYEQYLLDLAFKLGYYFPND
ncbi:MAG: hypothetical protein K2L42_04305 [Clostridia bacterium]|nr:hypothetical protein [Clostridia bacterium]